MAGRSRSTTRRADTYFEHTQRPLNCLVFVLPLLVVFHIGTAVYGSSLKVPRYLEWSLRYFGAPGGFLPPLLILVVLLLQHAARKDPWKIHGVALAGMVGESVLWTIPLVVLHKVSGRLTEQAAAAIAWPDQLAREILVSLGAGIYEEFVFRLMFISLAMLLLLDVFGLRKEIVEAVAVIAAGVVFSLCHFTGDQPAFQWGRFIFLALAGTLWGAAYLFRGFGVAVGSHIAWDIYALFFSS